VRYDYGQSSDLGDAVYEYFEALRLCRVGARDVVLDVGCGMNWLKLFGFDVIGIDLAENSRADIIADARMLPLRSKSVDVAVSIEVIEHLPREGGERLVAELARVARRCIAVSTARRGLRRKDPRHVHEYSLFELLRLVKRFAMVVDVGFVERALFM